MRCKSERSKHRLLLYGYTALGLSAAMSSGFAQDDFFNSVNIEVPRPSDTSAPYSLFGWLDQKIGYGLEAPDAPFSRQQSELSRVETSLFAQFDSSIADSLNLRISGKAYRDIIYSVKDDTQFSDDEINKFRSRFEVKDFFLEHQFDNGIYLKVGNQLFAWGLAEYSRITDLVSTEDQLTFGQQDLEDLRLQVPATLVSFNLGNWRLDSVLTYKAGRNDTAPALDEFDQFLRLRDSGFNLQREQPEKQYETFLRASTHWARGDFQIVAGEFNDNSLSLDRIETIETAGSHLVFSQNRMRALGVAGNWVNGSWLLFGEVGLHLDKAVQPTAEAFPGLARGWAQKNQVLAALGLEYNGIRNILLTLELDNTHTIKHDGLMVDAKNQNSFGVRVYWTALNERLELIAVRNQLVDADTHLSRLSINYNWSDQLELGLLWMNYSSARNSQFHEFRNNDLLQIHLQYNFQI